MNEEQIIQNFSQEMLKKIELRRTRYVPFAWKEMDIKRLLSLLKGEIEELEESMELEPKGEWHPNNLIKEEAVDIANYAMFIHELSK